MTGWKPVPLEGVGGRRCRRLCHLRGTWQLCLPEGAGGSIGPPANQEMGTLCIHYVRGNGTLGYDRFFAFGV